MRPLPSLKARALRYLSAREHSRMELARKLARHVQQGEDVDALLDTLEAAKLLSQVRFSESLVHRRANRFGNNRILSELHSHGISGAALTDIKLDLASSEATRAHDVWQKKFGHVATDAAGRVKQMRFLQQRGFSLDAIRSAMRGNMDESADESDDV
jgi:regulatory protein